MEGAGTRFKGQPIFCLSAPAFTRLGFVLNSSSIRDILFQTPTGVQRKSP
jgi:hypothetical protein